MRIKTVIPYIFLTILLVSVTAIIYARTSGKITGIITDKETGKPVVGASVLVIGTKMGAMTDFDGRFVISQLAPGSYNLRISHLDYNTVTITAVTVKEDITTEASYQMTKKISELDVKVEIRHDIHILDSFQTSIPLTIRREIIEHQPVSTVDELLNSTGKVKSSKGEVIIRGGRGYKPAYIVDGVPLGVPHSSLGKVLCNLYDYIVPPGCQDIIIGTGPAHGGTAIVNGEAFDAMFFKQYGVNPFVDTEDDHLSTFAIDVDDASFVMTRSYLDRGSLPPDEAVRTEEFVNHFNYRYKSPYEEPFRVYLEGAPSKFGQNCQMLKFGIKGMEIAPENRKAANLVFVIDISGSMAREDRLELVKKALRLLVDELKPNDKVGIVVYGSRGRVVLQPTSISNKSRIVSAIEMLHTGGSTNAEEGIMLGYEMSDRCFESGKINRIILCSDGVANVGRTKAEDLLKQIKKYADRGITLSSIGFGMGNYNDILLEKLGNKGNGHYAYVDNLPEAKRIFVDNLTGNLQVIARDVKIQVDFNPEVVRSYRLLGYENRDVEDNKFRDDKEDGGEIGAGHEVTALYEIKFKEKPASSLVGTIYIRYKDPDNGEVTEISRNITRNVFKTRFDETSFDFKLASCAAEFAEILRKSYWAKGSKLGDVLQLAKELIGESDSQELIELMGLIAKAEKFEQQLAEK